MHLFCYDWCMQWFPDLCCTQYMLVLSTIAINCKLKMTSTYSLRPTPLFRACRLRSQRVRLCKTCLLMLLRGTMAHTAHNMLARALAVDVRYLPAIGESQLKRRVVSGRNSPNSSIGAMLIMGTTFWKQRIQPTFNACCLYSCAAVSHELNRNPAYWHVCPATKEQAPVLSLAVAATIVSHYRVLIYTNPSLESSIWFGPERFNEPFPSPQCHTFASPHRK